MTAKNPSSFVEWYRNLPISWLVGGAIGAKFWDAHGRVLDDQADRLKQAREACMPSLAPADALPHIGGDRGLIQGPKETDANFRVRLRTAWDQWSRAGTALSMLEQLAYYTQSAGAVFVQQNGLGYQLSGMPTPGQDPTSLLQITTLGAFPYAASSFQNVNPSKTIPASSPWWFIDGDYAYTSRFAILYPTSLPTMFRTTGTATFSASNTAAVAWSNPFPTSSYQVMVGAVSTGGTQVTVNANAKTQTTAGITINASGPFTGTVTCLAWQTGANPLADLHPSDLANLRIIINRWKPGNMVCTGIDVLTKGQMAGWPVQTSSSSTANAGEIVRFSP